MNLDGQLDLSSLGVDELSAFFNGSNDTNPFGDGSADDFISNLFNDTGSTEMSQAETDRLLASLSQPSGQVSAGGTGDFNFDFGATDGGEMDMSQLTALFEANDNPISEPPPLLQQNATAAAPSAIPKEIQPPTAQPVPTADKAGDGPQAGSDGGHKKRPSIGVGSTPANPSDTPQASTTKTPVVDTAAASQVPAPVQPTQAQSALDEAMANIGDGQDYDLSNIDLDDFNFGDGSIPNVEGDEFESLFAEFK